MEMQLIDTHCHLYVDAFDADRSEMIERAVEEGVTQLLLPAIDSSELEALLALEAAFPETCKAMMGLHPCSVKEDVEKELDLVKTWLDKRPFIAIGEIGLDYYWDKTFIKEQQEAFRRQVQWSLDYDLPIVIHSRSSVQDCISILKEFTGKRPRGIFHCFSDDLATAHQIMDLGFYMGIGGVVTYKKAELAEVVKDIPLEWLVLETDAPYLPPVPFRGKRNESAYIKFVAAKVAEMKRLSIEEIASITTQNAKKIFGI